MAIAVNVLFVNVGAGKNTGVRCRYDGSETIEGGHGWLTEHGDNCAEKEMFVRRTSDGLFHSHAGRGGMKPRDVPFDVVFVAKDRAATGRRKHVVLGMYEAADYLKDREFARVTASKAIIIPPNRRGKLRIQWPGRVRMWARRHGTTRYADLVNIYRQLPGRNGTKS